LEDKLTGGGVLIQEAIMFGILFKVKVKAKMRQAFIEFIKWDIRSANEHEPGTLRFDLYQGPADKTPFLFTKRTRIRKPLKNTRRIRRFRNGNRRSSRKWWITFNRCLMTIRFIHWPTNNKQMPAMAEQNLI
jgi:hypothetical protein